MRRITNSFSAELVRRRLFANHHCRRASALIPIAGVPLPLANQSIALPLQANNRLYNQRDIPVFEIDWLFGALEQDGKPRRYRVVQSLTSYEHWHIATSYVIVCGTFYYLTSVLNSVNRYLVPWELREGVTKADVSMCEESASDGKVPDR